jgi:hypothetical protein
MNPNLVLQLLISASELYTQMRAEGYNFDGKSEEELRQKLREMNKELKALPDLEDWSPER